MLYDAAWKSAFLSGMMMPLMTFIGNFAYVVVCIVGGALALSGTISFGIVVAFMIYIRLFTQPLQIIAQAATSVQPPRATTYRSPPTCKGSWPSSRKSRDGPSRRSRSCPCCRCRRAWP
ncbi:MAG: ABC transporter transmembrane domain-containing protein [Coriobacteriales bacterium]|nr:ABC transporter transmembrane domain-containing protein [Coriobacteriales bacterium]